VSLLDKRKGKVLSKKNILKTGRRICELKKSTDRLMVKGEDKGQPRQAPAQVY